MHHEKLNTEQIQRHTHKPTQQTNYNENNELFMFDFLWHCNRIAHSIHLDFYEWDAYDDLNSFWLRNWLRCAHYVRGAQSLRLLHTHKIW